MPELFLVCSPGYTATKWLAWALDSDPRVSCNHSAGLEPRPRDYTAAELRDLAHEKLKIRDGVPLHRWLRRWAEEAEGRGARAVGNVHRYSVTALRRNQASFGAGPPLACMNLVRHPVCWLESGARQLGHMHGVSRLIRARLVKHRRAHRERYDELGAPTFPWPSELAFLYLCHRLTRLAEEARDVDVIHRRYEDLTGDPEVLAADFERLTRLSPEPAWLERVRATRLHQHRARPVTAAEQIAVWPAWKRRVYRDALERSGIAEAYARFGYALEPAVATRSRASPAADPERPATLSPARWTPGELWPMPARPLRWGRWVEPNLRRVRHRVMQAWVARGITLPRADNREVPMSQGLDGEVPPVLRPVDSASWTIAAVHPWGHDRSPAVVARHRASGRQATLNYKGAGIRSLADSFVVRAGRCPGYLATLGRDLHKPIDLLIDRPPGEWLSHELIGGASGLAAWFEARHALAWHARLLEHDGEPADVCLPLRMWRPREVEVRVGEQPRRVSLPELFTDPALVTEAQLAQLARDVRLPRWLPRSLLGAVFVALKQPVVYEHATRAKLRVEHLADQLFDDAAMAERAGEARLAVGEVVQAWLAQIYAEQPGFSLLPAGDLASREARLDYLQRTYAEHRELADALLVTAGRRAGRSLGALHGAGGHLLGRRLPLPKGRGGKRPRDRVGLVRRVGAPGGGSTAPRNCTVAGEWVDCVHLFNPRHDPIARLARRLSALPVFAWADGDMVERFQESDVEQAELAMAMLDAVVMGEPERLPSALSELQGVRRDRKRHEDALRRGEGAAHRERVVALEARALELRRRCPELRGGPALTAMREAYERHRRHAARELG